MKALEAYFRQRMESHRKVPTAQKSACFTPRAEMRVVSVRNGGKAMAQAQTLAWIIQALEDDLWIYKIPMPFLSASIQVKPLFPKSCKDRFLSRAWIFAIQLTARLSCQKSSFISKKEKPGGVLLFDSGERTPKWLDSPHERPHRFFLPFAESNPGQWTIPSLWTDFRIPR